MANWERTGLYYDDDDGKRRELIVADTIDIPPSRPSRDERPPARANRETSMFFWGMSAGCGLMTLLGALLGLW